MAKDLVNVTVAQIVARAQSVVGQGKYSMARGFSSMADPAWKTPFDPQHGTGDCIAFALWAQGIYRFHRSFLPDPSRWSKEDAAWHTRTTRRREDNGKLIPGHDPSPCIWGMPGAPGWINCDSILHPNTLFRPIPVEYAQQGDLIVFGSYKHRGKHRPGHIGVVDKIQIENGSMRVTAWHLNGRTKNVAHNVFPTMGREGSIRFLRPYNREKEQLELPGVV